MCPPSFDVLLFVSFADFRQLIYFRSDLDDPSKRISLGVVVSIALAYRFRINHLFLNKVFVQLDMNKLFYSEHSLDFCSTGINLSPTRRKLIGQLWFEMGSYFRALRLLSKKEPLNNQQITPFWVKRWGFRKFLATCSANSSSHSCRSFVELNKARGCHGMGVINQEPTLMTLALTYGTTFIFGSLGPECQAQQTLRLAV